MALNEFEMNNCSEDSTGTGGRVDELTLPVETSSQQSEQTHANEKDLDLELNLQKENIGAGPSGGSREDDELVRPVSESRSEAEVEGQGQITFLEPIREEDEDDVDGDRTHQPVGDPQNTDHTVTEDRTHQPVGDSQNTDHTVTEEESDRICRTCGPDEEIPEPDNLLVKLGCHCRGSLCRMHRKCIIEWYGPRMYREKNYKCELCNALLHGRIEGIVYRAFIGRDSGRDILFKALGRDTTPRRSDRPRRHRNANVVEAAPTNRNARPDFHPIQIREITHPGSRQAQNEQEYRAYRYRSTPRLGYLIWVLIFIIVVLIGFGVASIAKAGYVPIWR